MRREFKRCKEGKTMTKIGSSYNLFPSAQVFNAVSPSMNSKIFWLLLNQAIGPLNESAAKRAIEEKHFLSANGKHNLKTFSVNLLYVSVSDL